VTDLIKRKEVSIIYCPTDLMIGDYMTKALVGSKFNFFWNLIMNFDQSIRRSVLEGKVSSKSTRTNESILRRKGSAKQNILSKRSLKETLMANKPVSE
jgi:hypothetical protein